MMFKVMLYWLDCFCKPLQDSTELLYIGGHAVVTIVLDVTNVLVADVKSLYNLLCLSSEGLLPPVDKITRKQCETSINNICLPLAAPASEVTSTVVQFLLILIFW